MKKLLLFTFIFLCELIAPLPGFADQPWLQHWWQQLRSPDDKWILKLEPSPPLSTPTNTGSRLVLKSVNQEFPPATVYEARWIWAGWSPDSNWLVVISNHPDREEAVKIFGIAHGKPILVYQNGYSTGFPAFYFDHWDMRKQTAVFMEGPGMEKSLLHPVAVPLQLSNSRRQ